MKVLVFAGPPLAGKSTLAKAFYEKARGWTYLEVDNILSIIIPDSNRCLEHRKLGYHATHNLLKILFNINQNVLLDCTYSRLYYRRDMLDVLNQIEAEVYIVEFYVDLKTALERYQKRLNHPAIDLTEKGVIESINTYPYSNVGLKMNIMDLNTTKAVDKIVAFMYSSSKCDIELWVKYGNL